LIIKLRLLRLSECGRNAIKVFNHMWSCPVKAIAKSNIEERARSTMPMSKGAGGSLAEMIPPTKKRITTDIVIIVAFRPFRAPMASGNFVLALLNTTVLKKKTGTFKMLIIAKLKFCNPEPFSPSVRLASFMLREQM